MFPYTNLNHNEMPILWHHEALLIHLGQQNSPASIKKLERVIMEKSYLPPVIQQAAIMNELNGTHETIIDLKTADLG